MRTMTTLHLSPTGQLSTMTSLDPSIRAADQPVLSRTPGLLLGPFYPVERARDDTSPAALVEPDMPGRRLELSGHVFEASGRPLAGALVELWHADAQGRYRHPLDPRVTEIDARFGGYTNLRSGADGAWRAATRVPGPYTEQGTLRAPHVHVQVTVGAARLVTQMFLPCQPLNASDRWYRAVPNPERLIGVAVADEVDRLILYWDIVIGCHPLTDLSGAIA